MKSVDRAILSISRENGKLEHASVDSPRKGGGGEGAVGEEGRRREEEEDARGESAQRRGGGQEPREKGIITVYGTECRNGKDSWRP